MVPNHAIFVKWQSSKLENGKDYQLASQSGQYPVPQ